MNDLNPKWKILYIPLAELCDNDPAMPLMISVFDFDDDGDHDLIGSVTMSLDNMKTLAESCEPVRLFNGEKKAGKLLVTECMLEELQELGRKMSGCYPARRGSAYSLSQDEEHQQQSEEHQAQAQHLLSQ